jgi:hypothetical protein
MRSSGATGCGGGSRRYEGKTCPLARFGHDRDGKNLPVILYGLLTSGSIRSLIDKGYLQRSLFDEANLAEIHCPAFPGERLIACLDPVLAKERARKRQELLQATEKDLERLSREVSRRTKKPRGKADVGLKAGRLLGRYKMGNPS